MKRWAWASVAAFAGAASALGQVPPSAPPAASSAMPNSGEVVVIRTAGQPDRHLKVLRITGSADADALADVQDVTTGAKYTIPAKVLVAMARDASKSMPLPPLPSSLSMPNQSTANPVKVPTTVVMPPVAPKPTFQANNATAAPASASGGPRAYAMPDPSEADVIVIRTSGQPDRRVKVLRLSGSADGEAVADVQDLASGSMYVLPAKVLATLMRAAPRTTTSVAARGPAKMNTTPIIPPVRPQAAASDPTTGWPRPTAPTAIATQPTPGFRTSIPFPAPPTGSHSPFVQVPLSTPNDSSRSTTARTAKSDPRPGNVPSIGVVTSVVAANQTIVRIPPPIVPAAELPLQATVLVPPPIVPAAEVAVQATVLVPPPIVPAAPVTVEPALAPPKAVIAAEPVIVGRPLAATRRAPLRVSIPLNWSILAAKVVVAPPPTPILTATITPRPLAAVRLKPARIVVPADWPASVEAISAASASVASQIIPASATTPIVAAPSPAASERPIVPTGAIAMPQPIAAMFSPPAPSRFVEPLPVAWLQPGPAEYRVADRMAEETQTVLADLTKAVMSSIRERAATTLAESRYGWKPEIKAHLAIAAQTDAAPSVRAHCIGLLAKLGYHESPYLTYLEEAAASSSPDVQKAAKAALAKLAPKK